MYLPGAGGFPGYDIGLFGPVFVDFPYFFELVPEFGRFEVIAGGSQHAVNVAELPPVADIPFGDHFARLRDSPVCLQGLDDEVAEGDYGAEGQD
jgi:hypothetical protein